MNVPSEMKLSVRVRNDGQDHRRSKRIKVFKSADLLVNGVRSRSHILNVSVTGAMVHTPTSVLVGSMIRICAAGLDRHGVVVWKDGSKFGLRFNRLIALPQIHALQVENGQI